MVPGYGVIYHAGYYEGSGTVRVCQTASNVTVIYSYRCQTHHNGADSAGDLYPHWDKFMFLSVNMWASNPHTLRAHYILRT